MTKQLISHVSHRGKGDDNQQQDNRSGIRRRASHHSIPPQEHELEVSVDNSGRQAQDKRMATFTVVKGGTILGVNFRG